MGPVQLRRPSLETDALQPRPISSSLSRTAGWVSVMRVLVVCDEKGQGSGLREWGRSQRPTSRKPRDVWHPARGIKGKIKGKINIKGSGQECPLHTDPLAAGVGQFYYGAIVVERGALAKIGDGGEHVLHRSALPGHLFEAFAVKHISAGVLGFGDAIGHQDQPIPRPHLAAVA